MGDRMVRPVRVPVDRGIVNWGALRRHRVLMTRYGLGVRVRVRRRDRKDRNRPG